MIGEALEITIVVSMLVLVIYPSTTTITPERVRPAPEQKIDTVIVADLTSEDELLNRYIPYLRQGLVARLREAEDFREVIVGSASPAPPAAPTPPTAIARATFEIKDAGGATLARFESRKAYSGGAGFGGANLPGMDDLVRKLGEETANSLIRWSNGEPLEPSARKSQ